MIKAKRSAYGENGSGSLLNVTGRPFLPSARENGKRDNTVVRQQEFFGNEYYSPYCDGFPEYCVSLFLTKKAE